MNPFFPNCDGITEMVSGFGFYGEFCGGEGWAVFRLMICFYSKVIRVGEKLCKTETLIKLGKRYWHT